MGLPKLIMIRDSPPTENASSDDELVELRRPSMVTEKTEKAPDKASQYAKKRRSNGNIKDADDDADGNSDAVSTASRVQKHLLG